MFYIDTKKIALSTKKKKSFYNLLGIKILIENVFYERKILSHFEQYFIKKSKSE